MSMASLSVEALGECPPAQSSDHAPLLSPVLRSPAKSVAPLSSGSSSETANPSSSADLPSAGSSPLSTLPPTRQSSAQEGDFLGSPQDSRGATPSWMRDDDPFAHIVRRAAAPSLSPGQKGGSGLAASFSGFGVPASPDSHSLAASTLSDGGLRPLERATLERGADAHASGSLSGRTKPGSRVRGGADAGNASDSCGLRGDADLGFTPSGLSPAGASSVGASPLFFSDADLQVLAAPENPKSRATRAPAEETSDGGREAQNLRKQSNVPDELDEFFSSAHHSQPCAYPSSSSSLFSSSLRATSRGEQPLAGSLIDGEVLLSAKESAERPVSQARVAEKRKEELRRDSDAAEHSPTAAESWSIFNRQMQGWDVVQKEGKRPVADVEEQQLEDAGKKTVWVVHQGACTPVSWYEDTSAEDVKAAVLCACDVMLDDDVEERDEGSGRAKGRTGFALRQIEPLPQTADVDCESLFLDVCVLHLREGEAARPGQLGGGDTPLETQTGERDNTKQKALKVVKGRRVRFDQFGRLMDGCTYMLEKYQEATEEAEKELEKMQSITGDRWRRLLIPVHPLLHIESQKAFERMMQGTNLLKHTSYGYPHLRQFQLSMDRRRLLWYTSSKAKSSSVVHLSLLRGILFGQQSPTFESYRLPGLQHLSFSLVFWSGACPPEPENDEDEDEDETERKTRNAIELKAPIPGARTLDLTCKDEFEFDMWITGLKAIIAANKGLRVSKKLLLSHSRRFRRALARNNVTIKLTALPEVKEPGQVNLDDCMDLPWHPPELLQKKYDGLQRRIQAAAVEIRRLNYKQLPHGRGATIPDVCELSGSGPAYAGVYGEVGEVDDEEMEHRRMVELLHQVFSVLSNARVALSTFKSEIERKAAEAERENFRHASEDSGSGAAAPQTEHDGEQEREQEREETKEAREETEVVVSISSSGEVTKKSRRPESEAGARDEDLSFEEKFKKYSSRSASSLEAVQAVQEQVKESVLSLWQQAAPISQEAQKLFENAVAAVVGNDEEVEVMENGDDRSWTVEEISRLKHINQLLWKAEVDLENVEDILARFQQSHLELARGIVASVSDLNQKLSEEVHRWGSQLTSFMSDFVSRLNTLPAALVADDAQAALRATAASASSSLARAGRRRVVSSAVEGEAERRQAPDLFDRGPAPPTI
ncbi:UNVERIFIED_CONTAM: hypothetical protein HHA_226340 [Hammondia hammondi]|eukprot:XP_008882004.1 hypothetical protein HHA_226340 [Hammondia hammondi]